MALMHWTRWAFTAGLILLSWGCGGAPDVLTVDDTSDMSTVVDSATGIGKVQPATDLSGADCLALGGPQTPTQQAMLDALNQYRAEKGLKPLVYSKRLEAAADAMTRDLWERNFFAHVDPDGKNPGDRAINAGFCHKYVGENLAAGQKSIAAVMQAWKDSSGHDQNMLEPDYVYVGLSFSVDANGRLYWAQEFAYDLP